MADKKPAGKPAEKMADKTADKTADKNAIDGAPKKNKKEKVSIDPAQRGKGGFDRSMLKGKAPIFRTMKKSGR